MEDLAGIVARAALPEERRDPRHFGIVETPRAVLDARRAAFVQSVTDGDEGLFAKLLAARGTTPEEFLRSLSDVELRAPPAWARSLASLLADAFGAEPRPPPAERGGESSRELLLRVALAPFVRAGERFLDRTLLETAVQASDEARGGMINLLERRLMTTLGPALGGVLEEGPRESLAEAVAQVHGRWSRREAWIAFFARHPVAARLLATVHGHACDYLAEMLRRLARDERRIARELFDGAEPGELRDFVADTGDTHEEGRAVAILGFRDGRRLAYKPRDSRIGAWYFALARRVNAAEPSLRLHERVLLCGEGYAWDTFVERGECRSAAEVRDYFLGMGRLLRLLQLLECRDFHHENVLPAGARPAAVDVETMLQPRHRLAADLAQAERAILGTIEDSALQVGILSLPVASEPGRRAIDLGALSTPGTYAAPFQVSDPLRDAHGYSRVDLGDAAPRFGGEPVDPALHLDEVQLGYEEMDRALRAHAGTVLDGPRRAEAAKLTVRYLHRPTQIYARLLLASLMPPFLEDGLRWEASLARLWKAYLKNPHFGAGVYEAEMRAMRRLDVPVFYSRPGSDALVLDDGREVPGFFDGTALDRLEARLEWREPPGAGADIVRSALSLHPGDRARPLPPPPPPIPRPTLAPSIEIADFILDRAVRGEDGQLAWLGVAYHPWADYWTLGPLDTSLLSGTAGLALLFDDLARATGLDRYREAAAACLRGIARATDRMPGELAARRRQLAAGRRPPIYCGLFYGFGGSILAARRLDPPLAARLASALPLDLLGELAPADLVSGLAGLLVAVGGSAALRAEVLARRDRPPPYPDGATALDGLPDTAAGIALALGEPLPPGPATTGRLLAELAAGGAGVEELPSLAPLERLELALTTYQATGRFEAEARAAAGEILARRRASGSWFPASRRADAHNLSAIFGLGALAHAFLRLERPAEFAPLRLAGLFPRADGRGPRGP